MNAVEIVGLHKEYAGPFGKRVKALTDLHLSIAEGEVFGFLGPNGAGKSTTIKVLTGQVRSTAGYAKIFGVSVADATARRRLGYLPENPAFYDFMTAREYLSFVGPLFNMTQDQINSESKRVLELLDLEGAADRPIRGYSKGMVQRLGLAQALFHDPDVYILDEPMSGLDPIGRALVKDIIGDLKRRNKTIFFSTHITSDIEVVCDRVGVIVSGRLRVVDSVKNVAASGVEGYTLQVENDDISMEHYVAHADLSSYLAEAVASGATVSRIEPKRKDMEAFFLDIVNRAHET